MNEKLSYFTIGLLAGVLCSAAAMAVLERDDGAVPGRRVLKLAHNLESTHPVHAGMEFMKKRIEEKRRQYNALMQNLASGALPGEVVADIGQQMQELKSQIATLEQTEPPKDFTTETIQAWLEAIKAAPDVDAVHLLIERIDTRVDKEKEKTDFNMESTLKSVLRKHGCGGWT